jgi:hypothetical protein
MTNDEQQFPLWLFELGFIGFLGFGRIDLQGLGRIILQINPS